MNKIPKSIIAIFILLSGFVFVTGCRMTSVEKPLRVALSSGSENYRKWLHRGDSTVDVVDLHSMRIDSAIKLLGSCDAIVFTGGEDVVPAYYGRAMDSTRCESNPARDSLEFALIKEALRIKMPIIGVCRGQQILNVAIGGSLIIDIPTDHPGKVVHKCDDYLHCFHNANINKVSRLYEITHADSGQVTTNHHQAVDKVAPDFRVVAQSDDSIAESIEWKDPKGKSFLIAVQWHPERMGIESPLSMPLMNVFLKEAATYRKQK